LADLIPDARELHRVITASVRELLETARLEAQAGPVDEASLERLIFRAAAPIVHSVSALTEAQRGEMLPNIVRVMLAAFLGGASAMRAAARHPRTSANTALENNVCEWAIRFSPGSNRWRSCPGVGRLDNGGPGRFYRSGSSHPTRRSIQAFSLLQGARGLLRSGDSPRKGVAHGCALSAACCAGGRAPRARACRRKFRSGRR
jgi:hypothetical protein